MIKYEEIRDILIEHKGRENAITSNTITSKIGVDSSPSMVDIREIITITIFKFELPIVSSNSGYYLLREKDDEDVERYERSLDQRVQRITRRKVLIRHFFNKKYNKEEELELTGEIFDEDVGDLLDI